MERLKQFWFRLVARSLVDEVARLKTELAIALKPRPLDADVNGLLRRSLENHLAQEAVVGNDVRILRGKIDLLRQQLVNELAYSTYLEENLVPDTIEFNDLSHEQREAYFNRVQTQI